MAWAQFYVKSEWWGDEWRERIVSLRILDSGPKIPKVPEKLLTSEKKSQKCYNPLVVSIGTYHRSDVQRSSRMGRVWRIQWHASLSKKLKKYKEKLYQEVEKVAGKVRGFYDKSLIEEIGEEDFAKMMFIDGCFVVEFIHCVTSKYDDLHMSDQEVADVKRDLLLLENQLPYPVLDSLMNLRFTEEEKKNRIDEFLQIRKPHKMLALVSVVFLISMICFCCCCCFWYPSAPKIKKRTNGDKQHSAGPAHLLELNLGFFLNLI